MAQAGPVKKAKSTKKGRKVGRNKAYCEAYRRADKHRKSHISRLTAHLERQPGDSLAQDALRRYKSAV